MRNSISYENYRMETVFGAEHFAPIRDTKNE
mgnify:CR=1 FL=1